MTTPWVNTANVPPSDTVRDIAASYRESHDPAAIAERAITARAEREAKRMMAIMGQAEAGGGDPRTSAEIIAGQAHHDAAYDDPRAKRYLPPPPGPKVKDGDGPRQPTMDELINRAVKELGVPRDKAEKMAMLWLQQRA